MNILAIDTSSRYCSVCLLCETNRFTRRDDTSVSHSRHLLGLIQHTIDEADLRLEQLDAIAVVQGPGSFTGLRIGIAMTQGLAFAHQIPVVPVSSLAAVAMKTKQAFTEEAIAADAVLATMDARMGELYCGWYDVRDAVPKLIGREWVLKPADLNRVGELHFDEDSGLLTHSSIDELINSMAKSLSIGASPRLLMVGEGLCYEDQIAPPCLGWISSTVDLSGITPDASVVASYAAHVVSTQGSIEAEQLIPSYLRDNVTS